MKLSVKERILILGILPQEANLLTLKIIRDMENQVGFSETEIKELEMKALESGQITWSHDPIAKEIEINGAMNDIIKNVLKKKSDECKLTKDHLSLCEKFEL